MIVYNYLLYLLEENICAFVFKERKKERNSNLEKNDESNNINLESNDLVKELNQIKEERDKLIILNSLIFVTTCSIFCIYTKSL